MWDLQSHKPINTLALHQSPIQYIAFLQGNGNDEHHYSIITADVSGYIKMVKYGLSFFLREWEASVTLLLAATAGPIKVFSHSLSLPLTYTLTR